MRTNNFSGLLPLECLGILIERLKVQQLASLELRTRVQSRHRHALAHFALFLCLARALFSRRKYYGGGAPGAFVVKAQNVKNIDICSFCA